MCINVNKLKWSKLESVTAYCFEDRTELCGNLKLRDNVLNLPFKYRFLEYQLIKRHH